MINRPKIAVSINKELLDLLDSKVDNITLRSRSQAFEYFLRKGLERTDVKNAVILIKGEHHPIALQKVAETFLIRSQTDFLRKHGVGKVIVSTENSKHIGSLRSAVETYAELIVSDSKNNSQALLAAKDSLIGASFLAMSGDISFDFNLADMIHKHMDRGFLATMGLITRSKPKEYGNAILDGDSIVDFTEKPSVGKSFVVNAGIYIFKPEVFELLDPKKSLEHGLFPMLARIHQLSGFFIHGDYKHISSPA